MDAELVLLIILLAFQSAQLGLMLWMSEQLHATITGLKKHSNEEREKR